MPPPSQRRVLFLNWRDTSHPQGGGSERYVEQLARWLAAAGDDVFIHCAAHGTAPATETRDGVRFYRRGGRYSVYAHGLRAVRRLRPDLVVDVSNGVPFFSPLLHNQVVMVVHHVSRETWSAFFGGNILGRLGWWVESRVVTRLYRRARYVAVSGPTRDELVAIGVEADRVSVVHNAGEPIPERSVPPRSAPTLCVVSRLVRHKQVDHAVEVLARLVDEFPGLTLRVVGDGPSRAALLDRARELGVSDRVELLGPLDEDGKNDALGSSWVHLLPSVKEGWGRVVMEAAAHGVPTVAYRSSGGPRESIQDGVSGLLADDLAELASHTARLLREPTLRAAMGAAAREYAQGFTPERSLAEFRAALASGATMQTRVG
jgi:glycosyltransferase involved in cell wall biosynthesis